MESLALKWCAAYSDVLPDMPIHPPWILEGTPQATGRVFLQSSDKLLSSGLWECTPGRFRWEFAWDEFVHILSGEVEITELPGTTYTLRAGDLAHFPFGLKTEWHVIQTVRKVFTLRTPQPFVI